MFEELKMKRCRQCGTVKNISQFRRYYNRPSGHYGTCTICEKINARNKYLGAKEILTAEEQNEFFEIQNLYNLQLSLGLQPPKKREPDSIQAIINRQKQELASIADIGPIDSDVPFELSRWLTEDLDNRSPASNDEVYENLKNIYMPCVGYANDFSPIYDRTYANVLNAILDRFTAYEDAYWERVDMEEE